MGDRANSIIFDTVEVYIGDYGLHENSEGLLAEKDDSRLSREFAKEEITFL